MRDAYHAKSRYAPWRVLTKYVLPSPRGGGLASGTGGGGLAPTLRLWRASPSGVAAELRAVLELRVVVELRVVELRVAVDLWVRVATVPTELPPPEVWVRLATELIESHTPEVWERVGWLDGSRELIELEVFEVWVRDDC